MSEERPKGFLSRVFGAPEDEEDHTSVYREDDLDGEEEVEPTQDVPIRETGRNFTVERAAEIIKHLPPEVPRSSAVRIVRQTLTAAGINIEDLAESTRVRESKLGTEIDRREDRIRDLKDRTDEEIRSLERQIRDARETRDSGVASEERRITAARGGLEDIERVREFFSLPRGESQASFGEPSTSDETRVIDRSGYQEGSAGDRGTQDETRVIGRGGFPDDWSTGGGGERPR